MLWSLLLLIGLLAATRRLPELVSALRSRREAPRLALCAALLSLNWGFFLWGVNTGRVVEASLGYFITPLLNVLMGRFLLGERLSRAQTLAILIALTGVSWKIVVYGHVPWLALVVSASFALYGFFQKTLRVGAAPGLTAELVFLAPFALAWLAWAHPHDFGALAGHGISRPLLLAGTALFTAIPRHPGDAGHSAIRQPQPEFPVCRHPAGRTAGKFGYGSLPPDLVRPCHLYAGRPANSGADAA